MRPATILRSAVLVGGAGLAWGLTEPHLPRRRDETIPALPADTGPLRILHFSDLHLLPWQRRKMRWITAQAREPWDLVVATGDLLGHADAIAPLVETLARFADRGPCVTVLGSNDFFGPTIKNPFGYFWSDRSYDHGGQLDVGALVRGLESIGWTVLDNARRAVALPGGIVDVVGLGDAHIDRDRPEVVAWDDPVPDPLLRLGVAHSPYLRVLDAFAVRGWDLTLCGHTHGGQVRVPGIGALVDNCDLPLDQARGTSRHGDMWLHVSAGLGQAMTAPVRFACRPEASLLTVVPG